MQFDPVFIIQITFMQVYNYLTIILVRLILTHNFARK